MYIFQLIEKWTCWDNKFTENRSPTQPQVAGGMRLDKALLMTGAAPGAASGEVAPCPGTAGCQRAGENTLPSPRHHWKQEPKWHGKGRTVTPQSKGFDRTVCLRQSYYGVWCLGFMSIKCMLIKPNCLLACPSASPCVQNGRCLQQMFLLLEPVCVCLGTFYTYHLQLIAF